jgi:1,2-diacylglycerol 3-beta-glucosyltransferase
LHAADPWIGGVQLPVRIRNRDSIIARLQDWEFWVFSALTQIARARLGNTSLGGNGQFTRFAALESLDGLPWSTSLTEDLDLTLRLLLRGWRTTCVPEHHVNQQGLTSLRALVRQRTRWFQGHLVSLRYVPRLWMSPKLKSLTSIETVLYLLIPVALVLPWSILGHVNAVLFVQRYHLRSVLPVGGSMVAGRALDAFLLYILSFLPNLIAGYLYLRRDRSVGRLRAFAIGHVLVLYNYVAYIACWRALWRVLRGKTTWDKTQRLTETPNTVRPAVAT